MAASGGQAETTLETLGKSLTARVSPRCCSLLPMLWGHSHQCAPGLQGETEAASGIHLGPPQLVERQWQVELWGRCYFLLEMSSGKVRGASGVEFGVELPQKPLKGLYISSLCIWP